MAGMVNNTFEMLEFTGHKIRHLETWDSADIRI